MLLLFSGDIVSSSMRRLIRTALFSKFTLDHLFEGGRSTTNKPTKNVNGNIAQEISRYNRRSQERQDAVSAWRSSQLLLCSEVWKN